MMSIDLLQMESGAFGRVSITLQQLLQISQALFNLQANVPAIHIFLADNCQKSVPIRNVLNDENALFEQEFPEKQGISF